MSNKEYLTKEQYETYQKELDNLINILIPKNSDDIAAAVAQGDLSENAEYDSAKEEQAKLNQRVAKIQQTLANAIIIQENTTNDFIQIGHTITIEDTKSKEKITATLLGKWDETEKSISLDSPLGQALLEKKINDIVTIDCRAGELSYKILKIK